MKKTIICSITMNQSIEPTVYKSEDESLPVSDRKVIYPISAFLEKTMKKEDEIKFLLLVKKDPFGHCKKNAELFRKEIEEINENTGAVMKFVEIETDFSESKEIHEQLMGRIVNELEDGCHIQVDMTYGPKDLPLVIVFSLNFAEKFLNCSIDNIVYGQANFVDGKAVDTKICDMIPLYCLGSVSNAIHSMEPSKARMMLNSLLSI